MYCHSQASCKLEGIRLLEYCAEQGYNLLLWDFAGCGKSEGKYISLGWWEAKDLDLVVKDAAARFGFGCLFLWGRSMGAVGVLKFVDLYQKRAQAIVIDSPFPDLGELVRGVATKHMNIPSIFVSVPMMFVSSKIEEKIRVDIMKMRPIEYADRCSIPCCLIVGKTDDLVSREMYLQIYSSLGSNSKRMVYSEGGHSGEREEDVTKRGIDVFKDVIEEKRVLEKDLGLLKSVQSHREFDPFYRRGSRPTRNDSNRENSMMGDRLKREETQGKDNKENHNPILNVRLDDNRVDSCLLEEQMGKKSQSKDFSFFYSRKNILELPRDNQNNHENKKVITNDTFRNEAQKQDGGFHFGFNITKPPLAPRSTNTQYHSYRNTNMNKSNTVSNYSNIECQSDTTDNHINVISNNNSQALNNILDRSIHSIRTNVNDPNNGMERIRNQLNPLRSSLLSTKRKKESHITSETTTLKTCEQDRRVSLFKSSSYRSQTPTNLVDFSKILPNQQYNLNNRRDTKTTVIRHHTKSPSTYKPLIGSIFKQHNTTNNYSK